MTPLELTKQIATAYNTLNYKLFETILANNFIYDKQNQFDTIKGKKVFLEFIKNNFSKNKKAKEIFVAEIAYINNNEPCIAFNSDEDFQQLLMLIEIKSSKVVKLQLLTATFLWDKITHTDEKPGLVLKKSYKKEGIIPTLKNYVGQCKTANNEYKNLQQIPCYESLKITDWRWKYFNLYEYKLADRFSTNMDVINFKINHTKSIEYFYELLEREDEEYTENWVELEYQHPLADKRYAAPTIKALAPTTKKEMYNVDLWNKTLENKKYPKYSALYIEGKPIIKQFLLEKDKIKANAFILIIGIDGLISSVHRSNENIEFKGKAKGILILNAQKKEPSMKDLLVWGNEIKVLKKIK